MKNLKWKIPVSIALLAVAISLGITPLLAGPSTPTISVVPAVSSFAVGSGTDFTVYVKVPNNSPISGNFFDLRPAFVLQTISEGQTEPNGTVIAPTTVVSCTTPDYPARYAVTSCSKSTLYPGRVDTRAYWGSTTGIYFLGLVGFSPAGTWTVTFVVTGLYFGNTITLTGSTTVRVT